VFLVLHDTIHSELFLIPPSLYYTFGLYKWQGSGWLQYCFYQGFVQYGVPAEISKIGYLCCCTWTRLR
jgi:hypothetical protein